MDSHLSKITTGTCNAFAYSVLAFALPAHFMSSHKRAESFLQKRRCGGSSRVEEQTHKKADLNITRKSKEQYKKTLFCLIKVDEVENVDEGH